MAVYTIDNDILSIWYQNWFSMNHPYLKYQRLVDNLAAISLFCLITSKMTNQNFGFLKQCLMPKIEYF